MGDLAEMAVKSQTEAFDIIRKRVEENLAALGAPKMDKWNTRASEDVDSYRVSDFG
jgi:hypothetical protein